MTKLRFLLTFVFVSCTYADDIDVYLAEKEHIEKPNAIFILDTSGSMNFTAQYYSNYNTLENLNLSRTPRSSVLEASLFQTLASTEDINISLLRFSAESNGGFIAKKMGPIDDQRNDIKSKIENYDYAGGTPLSESLYEAYRYYYGKSAKNAYDNSRYFTNTNNSNWRTGYTSKTKDTTGVIDNSAFLDNTDKDYISPIKDQCQPNNIIVFTDGEASSDTGNNDEIQSLVASTDFPTGSSSSLSKSCSGNGDCTEELAYYMNQSPPTLVKNGKSFTAQPIKTYTIGGFFPDDGDNNDDNDPAAIKLLRNTAKYGDGKFFKGSNSVGLANALKTILDTISADTVGYSAPALTINSFNTFEHTDEIYFNVFQPSDKSRWNGNLKKLRINSDGKIIDANGALAIDETTGSFKNESKSLWSENADGNHVTRGGAIEQFTTSRKIYTYLNTYLVGSTWTDRTKQPNSTLNPSSLAASSDTRILENSNISTSPYHLNLDGTDINKSLLLRWISGVEEESGELKAHNYMGDSIHSTPLVLNYADKSNTGTYSDNSTIFLATNAGFLHAIDSSDGSELWSFVPQQMLRIQKFLYENLEKDKKIYGLDGPISSWFHDPNRDDLISNDGVLQSSDKNYQSNDKEFYQLYLGMRRGGRSYFSLDVSSRTSPKFLWQINGKTDKSIVYQTPGFSDLGLTWSEMVLAKIRYNNKSEPVLIFTGGYDEYYDDTSNPFSPADGTIDGNAIYIVKARTGELLWKVTGNNNAAVPTGAGRQYEADMRDALPSSPSLLDTNDDGHTDTIYTTDIAGKVWRINIKQTGNFSEQSTSFTTNKIANLQASTITNSSKRYFFGQPDVTRINNPEFGKFIGIVVSSGLMPEPNEEIQENYIYMLRDKNLTSSLSTSDLYDVTDYDFIVKQDELKDMTSNEVLAYKTQYNNFKNKNGWMLKQEATGEKSFSKALSLGQTIFASTFAPVQGTTSTLQTDDCQLGEINIGTAYLYTLDYITGGSIKIYQQIEKESKPDKCDNSVGPGEKNLSASYSFRRKAQLDRSGLPPTPTVVFPPAPTQSASSSSGTDTCTSSSSSGSSSTSSTSSTSSSSSSSGSGSGSGSGSSGGHQTCEGAGFVMAATESFSGVLCQEPGKKIRWREL